MKKFVLDCSVTMTWCFEDEATESAEHSLALLKEMTAIVPSIWVVEVMNVLRVAERKNRINVSSADHFIRFLNTLPIILDSGLNHFLNTSILAISRKHSLSAYDAAYLEIALRYNIPLVSFDKNLCAAAKKEGVVLLSTEPQNQPFA